MKNQAVILKELLEDLPDDKLVCSEYFSYVMTVAELKIELENGNNDSFSEEVWYTAKPMRWNPDARYMLDSYIENEYQEMYEDWDGLASEYITDEVVDKIQKILDDAFSGEHVKQYYTLEKPIKF